MQKSAVNKASQGWFIVRYCRFIKKSWQICCQFQLNLPWRGNKPTMHPTLWKIKQVAQHRRPVVHISSWSQWLAKFANQFAICKTWRNWLELRSKIEKLRQNHTSACQSSIWEKEVTWLWDWFQSRFRPVSNPSLTSSSCVGVTLRRVQI